MHLKKSIKQMIRMNTLNKLLDFLDKHEKKQLLVLLILILFTAIIDMLGAASILPFIAVVANPEIIETNIIISKILNLYLNFGLDRKNFISFLGFCVLVFLICSLILRGLTNYIQIKFCFMREYTISKNLVQKYLSKDYIWFLNKHSGDLTKNILGEISGIIYKSFIPAVNIVVYGSLCIAIFILLLVVDTKLAIIVVLLFSFVYLILYYFVRKSMLILGEKRLIANNQRFVEINEIFSNIKEIKTYGLEEDGVNYFSIPAKNYAHSHSLAESLGQLPRYLVEGFAFGGIVFITIIFINKGIAFDVIAPILAIYAFCGYRLLPALQIIFRSITEIKYSSSALENLRKDYTKIKKDSNYPKKSSDSIKKLTLKKEIKLDKIYFTYPTQTKRHSLKNINISIQAGSTVGIIGQTGSGKTTLIDIILGLIKPDEGLVTVDGLDILKENKFSWQQMISYVPQRINLFDNSVASNIAFTKNNEDINNDLLEKSAKIAQIHDFIVNELSEGYQTNLGEKGIKLSGGQIQRIGIARALYRKSKVLILDEASSALDSNTEKELFDNLFKYDPHLTIILVTHRLSVAKNCDKIFIIDKGLVVDSGNYEKIISKKNIDKLEESNV